MSLDFKHVQEFRIATNEDNAKVAMIANSREIVYFSKDGTTWQDVTPKKLGEVKNIYFADICPTDHSRLVTLSSDGRTIISRDGGKSWREEEALTETPERMVLDAVGNIYAVTQSGLYRRSFEKPKWLKLTDVGDNSLSADVAIHPKSGNIFASSRKGLWRSKDNGKNWTSIPCPGGPSNIALDPSSETSIFISAAGRIYHSADSGQSWTQISEQLAIWDFEIATTKPVTLFGFSRIHRTLWTYRLPEKKS
ncbi:MAG: hypothetical protein P1V97_19560 [Planctomycetota bacterium]|nr:hypothetical protein [Planctomycetota bacterium]